MSLDTLNPDIRDSVKEAARRAGMSVEQWVAATISDRAQRTVDSSAVRRRTAPIPAPAPIPVVQPVDELDAVAAKIARLAQGKPVPGRDLDTLLATASAETERRSRENAAKTAVALDAVARWIEGAESRLDQTTRTTAARQERTTAVLGEALGLMTRRLEEIERKFESGSQPALDKALKAIERVEAQMTRTGGLTQAQPAAEIETALRSFEERIAGITERIASAPRGGIGRRGLSARDELKSAVADIRVRKAELDDPANAPPRRTDAPEAAAPFGSGALDALRADIARLAGQLETVSRPSIEPAAKALQGEMSEMQQALGALATRREVGALEEAVRDLTRLVLHARDEGGDVAAVTAPIQELQAEVRRLSEMVAAGVHGRLAGDLEGLARKIDGMAGAHADSPVVADLARQFGDLRSTLAEIAEPHRVAGLAEQMGDLSRQVAQIGRSQVDALEFASLRAAVDEIRSHMRAAPRDGALQSAAAREIAALSAKLDTIVERLPNGDVEAFARMVETLSAKIDGVAAASARGPDLSTLDQRLADIAGRLDRVSAAPSQVSEQIRSLSERMDTVLLGRDESARIEPIVARLDRLDESLRRQPAAQPDLKPLEDMLRGLAERIDGSERTGSGDDGLDALERQVAAIAERLDRSDGTDPALSALQRAMGDLMVQVEGIRDDNYGLAERAAANAVATTLQTIPSAPGDLSDFKRDIDDLKALHGATDRRNRDTLEAVHTTLERLVERLASLETENARPRPAPKAAQAKAAPQGRDAAPDAMAALAQEALRKMDVAARAQGVPGFSSSDADRPLAHGGTDEILLEPGARPRPGDDHRGGAQAASEMKAALIAQARRAAQAAAAQTGAAAKAKPGRGIDMAALASAAGGAGGMAARVRQAIDKRRRPLLLGLAAIVLAIGTLQIVGGLVGGAKRTETARIETPARAIPAPAPPVASTAREVPARDVLAAPEPRAPEAAPAANDGAGRDRGAFAAPVRPADPIQVASADAAPLTTSALPTAPTATLPAPAAPEAPLGPIPNMASIGEIPANAGPPGLRQAALAGDPAAVYELASRAADGRGMMRDLKLAVRLFERAAAHGLVPAQFRVANHYEKGLGVTKDAGIAKAWYQRAAEKGNARAMHNLAVLLAEGAGAKPDYAAAVDWFRRAAEHGVRDSQFNLGVLLARGRGTKQDLTGAFTWFSVAAGQGDEDAGKKRDEVAARLTASELALARASAERWRPEIPARTANEVTLPAHGWSEVPAKPAKKT